MPPTPLMQIPRKHLRHLIGHKVHLRWANRACVWVLLEVNGDRAKVETPKSRKQRVVSVDDLQFVSYDDPSRVEYEGCPVPPWIKEWQGNGGCWDEDLPPASKE